MGQTSVKPPAKPGAYFSELDYLSVNTIDRGCMIKLHIIPSILLRTIHRKVRVFYQSFDVYSMIWVRVAE